MVLAIKEVDSLS